MKMVLGLLIVLVSAFTYQVKGAVAQYAVTDLGTLPGGTSSIALGVNNSGQIVGWSSGTTNHAFLYSAGSMQDLGALITGRSYSQATGINSNGQVVGFSYVNNSGGPW